MFPFASLGLQDIVGFFLPGRRGCEILWPAIWEVDAGTRMLVGVFQFTLTLWRAGAHIWFCRAGSPGRLPRL